MPGQLAVYSDLSEELREKVEDVILNRHQQGTENLVDIAEKYRGDGSTEDRKVDLEWRSWPVAKRLEHALVKRYHHLYRGRYRICPPTG